MLMCGPMGHGTFAVNIKTHIMRTLFNYPFAIYAMATLASLCIMVLVDHIMGAEAEHLNAWVIVNRLFGMETTIGDSLAIERFGLAGATLIMLMANTLIGMVLYQLLRLIIHFIKLF